MHKIAALTFALFMLAVACVAGAQEPSHITNVIVFDVGPDLAKFRELSKRADAISAKYGSTGKARVWIAAFAGPDSNKVIVAVEYPSLVSMAQSVGKVNSSPEWRQLLADAQATNIKPISNSIMVEIPPQ